MKGHVPEKRGEVLRETRIDLFVSITKEDLVSIIESAIVGIPPACQTFQAWSISEGKDFPKVHQQKQDRSGSLLQKGKRQRKVV